MIKLCQIKGGRKLRLNRKSFIFFLSLSVSVVLFINYLYYVVPISNKKVFGVTYMTMNNPFYEVINNQLKKIIEENGDQLITLDPQLSVDKQNEQIYKFIDLKVDGIFINPIEAQAIESALKAAKQANIPIITVDAPVINEELVDCTVVSDNYSAGKQCAEDMMKKMDSANIVLLKHSTALSAKERIDGFLDTIKNYPEYKIVNEGECNGQLEQAMPVMQKILQQTPQVDVVMALNDPSALGALAALESMGYNDVMVYGVDGTPDIKSLIEESPMVAGTVAQSPISIGQFAAKKMYQLLDGKKIDQEIIIPVEIITKENIYQHNKMGWQ